VGTYILVEIECRKELNIGNKMKGVKNYLFSSEVTVGEKIIVLGLLWIALLETRSGNEYWASAQGKLCIVSCVFYAASRLL
jgi:hypothetical protein